MFEIHLVDFLYTIHADVQLSMLLECLRFAIAILAQNQLQK